MYRGLIRSRLIAHAWPVSVAGVPPADAEAAGEGRGLCGTPIEPTNTVRFPNRPFTATSALTLGPALT